MLHIMRSRRRRLVSISICLPYLLLSVVADFVHVHPWLKQATASAAVQQVRPVPAQTPRRLPDAPCVVCQWHRTGPRLTAGASVVSAARLTPALIVPTFVAFPAGPVPHPSRFRGPPQLSLT